MTALRCDFLELIVLLVPPVFVLFLPNHAYSLYVECIDKCCCADTSKCRTSFRRLWLNPVLLLLERQESLKTRKEVDRYSLDP